VRCWEGRCTLINPIPAYLVILSTSGTPQAGIPKLPSYTQSLITHQQRRSIFGFFCRRCQTTFAKLSALAVLRLCQDYQAWCAGDDTAGYFIAEKDELSCMFSHIFMSHLTSTSTADLLLFKTLSDKKTWARPQFYEKCVTSSALGTFF